MNRQTLLLASLSILAALAPCRAWSADLYMCEIVKDHDSTAMVQAENNDVLIDADYRLVARSQSESHTIDLKILRNVGPAQQLLGHDIAYAATIEQGAGARPLLLPLKRDLTVQCANQDPDALTWSPRALKILSRTHGGEIAGGVEADMVGVKNSGATTSVAPAAQPAIPNEIRGSLSPLQ